MAERLAMTTPPSTKFGTNLKVVCTSICSVSLLVPMLLSNILPSGLLSNYSSLAVCLRGPPLQSSSLMSSFLDPQLQSHIRNSTSLIPNIRQLSISRSSSRISSLQGTPHSPGSQHSYTETDNGDGQGEIAMLSRRILEIIEDDGAVTPSASASQFQPGSLLTDTSSRKDHEELRKSVREAFAGGSSTH